MKKITTNSGIKGYQCHLQENYNGFADFAGYSNVFGLAAKLGFKTALQAWHANPIIQGSVNPEDFCTVTPPTQTDNRELFTGGEWKVGEIGTYGENTIVARPHPEDGGDIICEAPVEWEESMKRWRENAALIAAAPDMLNALIESLGALKSGYIQQRAKATELIIDAIKKATNKINNPK